MPRTSRIVYPGVPHHVTQRGNHQERVFDDDEDMDCFLHMLRSYAAKASLQVMAYCLMPNHTHLVVVPNRNDSMWKTFKPLHMMYSQRLNRKRERNGLNWQGRYFSAPMDESYTAAAVQYVIYNPVRAGMVAHPANYYWSSAQGLLGLRSDPVITAENHWLRFATAAVHELCHQDMVRDINAQLVLIRRNTFSNRPIGSHEFVAHVNRLYERRSACGKAGRPRKSIVIGESLSKGMLNASVQK